MKPTDKAQFNSRIPVTVIKRFKAEAHKYVSAKEVSTVVVAAMEKWMALPESDKVRTIRDALLTERGIEIPVEDISTQETPSRKKA